MDPSALSLLVMTVATVWLLNIANIYNKYLAEDELAWEWGYTISECVRILQDIVFTQILLFVRISPPPLPPSAMPIGFVVTVPKFLPLGNILPDWPGRSLKWRQISLKNYDPQSRIGKLTSVMEVDTWWLCRKYPPGLSSLCLSFGPADTQNIGNKK